MIIIHWQIQVQGFYLKLMFRIEKYNKIIGDFFSIFVIKFHVLLDDSLRNWDKRESGWTLYFEKFFYVNFFWNNYNWMM